MRSLVISSWSRFQLTVFAVYCIAMVAGVANAGTLWVTDTAGQVFQFNGDNGAFLSSTSDGGPDNPLGIAVGPDGNIYVASNNSNRNVLRYDVSTGAFLGQFTSDPTLSNDALFDVAFGPDQNLYVAVPTRDQVLRYSGSSGAFLGVFATVTGGPVGLAFGPDSNLYVATANTSEVIKLDGVTGSALASFSSPSLSRAAGLAFGLDGGLYVASQFTDQVLRFNVSDGSSYVFTSGGNLDAPNGVAFGPDGKLYVTSLTTGAVLRFDENSGAFLNDFVASGSGGLLSPAHLVFTGSMAAPIFTFDSNAEGWTNQVTEPFSVTFAPGQGFGGGGALAISATAPRDSYQIVHDEDPDWPTVPYFFQQITFDVRLAPGVEINALVTGVQIRDNIGDESNVYLATDFIDLGGGWTRIVMTPTNLFDLPLSHDDVGINFHIGTTSAFTDSLVMFIDNIAGVQSVLIPVAIDINPGSDSNPINPKRNGLTTIAILTTSTFDSTTVDPLSVKFGPNEATEAHGRNHIEDVNGDEKPDLILHFNTKEAGIRCGDTSASLTGVTFGGQAIAGSDSIRTVGCK